MNYEKLKDTRQKRGFTLAQVGEATGYTAGFLSQLERGLREPSLTTLRKLSDVYGVPIMSFVVDEKNDTDKPKTKKKAKPSYHIIRENDRKEATVPKVFTTCEFVTPLKTAQENRNALSGYIVKVKPGCWLSEKQVKHVTDESTYIIRGTMKAIMGKDVYILNAGDSIYIEAGTPHNRQNCGDDILEIISFIPIPLHL